MRVATEEFFFCYAFLLLLNWSCLGLGLYVLVVFPSLLFSGLIWGGGSGHFMLGLNNRQVHSRLLFVVKLR